MKNDASPTISLSYLATKDRALMLTGYPNTIYLGSLEQCSASSTSIKQPIKQQFTIFSVTRITRQLLRGIEKCEKKKNRFLTDQPNIKKKKQQIKNNVTYAHCTDR